MQHFTFKFNEIKISFLFIYFSFYCYLIKKKQSYWGFYNLRLGKSNLCFASCTGMFTRMLKLRLLNVVAPAYFFMATAVTFVFHFCFFVPAIFPKPETSLRGSTTLHTALFLFLMFNALGNYVMTIRYTAESAAETAVPVCSPHCSDKVDAHYLLNGRHFCKLCKKVILKRDHHCFFTGNCIGNKNMRYFIMFCIYTSCTCLYSLVLGVAFLTLEYSVSFENPLTFLTLLPLSTGYFFTGELFLCNKQGENSLKIAYKID